MPCKNPRCQQRTMDEDALIRMTAEELRRANVPTELARQCDTFASCARCTQIKIAHWLDELLYLRKMRRVVQ